MIPRFDPEHAEIWPLAMVFRFGRLTTKLPVGSIVDWYGQGDVMITGHVMLPAHPRVFRTSGVLDNSDGTRFELHTARLDGETQFDGTVVTYAEIGEFLATGEWKP